jgi:sugar lactone lactonase YvrE
MTEDAHRILIKAIMAVASVALIIISPPPAGAQDLLNYPESVVFDTLNNRYLVSNWFTGNLVEIDEEGRQNNFLTGQRCFAGVCIVDSNVYVACKSLGVRGFNLFTGDMIMDLQVPGTSLLNDIAADTSGNLYLSDPQVHKIIKVRISDQEVSTFVEDGILVPNGMIHDAQNNRMILVSARNNSPIQAIDLADSSVSVIRYTSYDILDGITRDSEGYYYVSSWGTSSVYRFDQDFEGTPVIISTHEEQPADISFNFRDNILAVPIFYNHYVDFVVIEPTAVDELQIPNRAMAVTNYPNPFNSSTTIEYELVVPSDVTLEIYDMLGRKVETLVESHLPTGRYRTAWDATGMTSGIYFCRIRVNGFTFSKNLLLLK